MYVDSGNVVMWIEFFEVGVIYDVCDYFVYVVRYGVVSGYDVYDFFCIEYWWFIGLLLWCGGVMILIKFFYYLLC